MSAPKRNGSTDDYARESFRLSAVGFIAVFRNDWLTRGAERVKL